MVSSVSPWGMSSTLWIYTEPQREFLSRQIRYWVGTVWSNPSGVNFTMKSCLFGLYKRPSKLHQSLDRCRGTAPEVQYYLTTNSSELDLHHNYHRLCLPSTILDPQFSFRCTQMTISYSRTEFIFGLRRFNGGGLDKSWMIVHDHIWTIVPE